MKDKNKSLHSTKSLMLTASLLTIAIVLGYIEAILFPSLPIPGIKVGLPSIITILLLYTEKRPIKAFVIGLLRCIIIALLFANFAMLLYSVSGFILSFGIMLFAKKVLRFRIWICSVAGGIFHNIAQLLVAYFVLRSDALYYYFPWLFLAGTIAGIFTGFLGNLLMKQFHRLYNLYYIRNQSI